MGFGPLDPAAANVTAWKGDEVRAVEVAVAVLVVVGTLGSARGPEGHWCVARAGSGAITRGAIGAHRVRRFSAGATVGAENVRSLARMGGFGQGGLQPICQAACGRTRRDPRSAADEEVRYNGLWPTRLLAFRATRFEPVLQSLHVRRTAGLTSVQIRRFPIGDIITAVR